MLAEMNAVEERVERTCPSCRAKVDEAADWCGQCYTRLRVTVPQSDLQRLTSMNPRLGNVAVPEARRSMCGFFTHLRDLGTRIGLSLAVAYGVAWAAFNLEAKWYVASIACAAYAVWTIWRPGRRYA